jgi:hypothetical protein
MHIKEKIDPPSSVLSDSDEQLQEIAYNPIP